MVIRAARPTLHHREPAGRQRQYRHRGGRQGAAGRLYAAVAWCGERGERDPLRQAQSHTRHRAGRGHRQHTFRHGSPSLVSGNIAYAKANPGKINFASPGNGTAAHVAGEMIKMMTGVNMVHIPYRGQATALTDLLGGQVQMFFGSINQSVNIPTFFS
jgi:hypothetical protein